MNNINKARINRFAEYLHANHYSENTIRSYIHTVKDYFELYDDITNNNISEFIDHLRQKNSFATVNQRINAINHFMRFENIDIRSFKLGRISRNKNSNNVITADEYSRLKECLKCEEDRRVYCLIRVLGSTGMRISETLEIKAGDILRGYIDVFSKGNKYRRVYFPVALEKDIIYKLAKIMPKDEYFFKNCKGQKLSPSGARYLLRKKATLYDIPISHIHPHAFRHRFALNFMEKQKDISMLSDLLGHESIETTRIYLSMGVDQQREIINRVVNW